jgi:hypothetical protein
LVCCARIKDNCISQEVRIFLRLLNEDHSAEWYRTLNARQHLSRSVIVSKLVQVDNGQWISHQHIQTLFKDIDPEWNVGPVAFERECPDDPSI